MPWLTQRKRHVVRAQGIHSSEERIDTWKRPGHLYRGMTETEYEAHQQAGQIKSKNLYSLPGEGTNFTEDPASAESYINFGRDDPRRTGKPTYMIEIRHDPKLEKVNRQGYYEAHAPVPIEHMTRVWRMVPEHDMIVATERRRYKATRMKGSR
jgi:hypothetical protein